MSGHQKFQVSLVEFRHNPAARQSGHIPIGILLGFSTDTYNVVALAIRSRIKSKFLDSLDVLSKSVIENRNVIIENEIESALEEVSLPKDVLCRLASQNMWSFHIAAPIEVEVPTTVPDAASVERMAQDYIFKIYQQKLEYNPSDVFISFAQHSYVFEDTGVRAHSEPEMASATVAWMPPPKVWMLPKEMADA